MCVSKSRANPLSALAPQLKNMWKLPGGLSEPGEDLGAYPTRGQWAQHCGGSSRVRSLAL